MIKRADSWLSLKHKLCGAMRSHGWQDCLPRLNAADCQASARTPSSNLSLYAFSCIYSLQKSIITTFNYFLISKKTATQSLRLGGEKETTSFVLMHCQGTGILLNQIRAPLSMHVNRICSF